LHYFLCVAPFFETIFFIILGHNYVQLQFHKSMIYSYGLHFYSIRLPYTPSGGRGERVEKIYDKKMLQRAAETRRKKKVIALISLK
jgi:hypothetical protein